ncbi:MAG: T9SS type A sorting domain-containing protein [Actinobacteria bacterium]|nr:T9SS type A sorting domain-containing protein [Actinomycetota bacterium]
MEPQIDNVITTVGKRDELPHDFKLSQNHPNPFNAGTTIRYRLARRRQVTLSIYNVKGQKIRLMEKAVKPAGVYQVHWDSKDDLGKPVNSGVFFCRLQLDDRESETIKLILLK